MLQEPQSILEYFFLFGNIPANAEKGVYIPYLVALSYIIASLGSFTGLRLATDIHKAGMQKLKNLLHLGGAFAFGVGIWSMHFIGMLAYKMDMTIAYDPFLTILSMVIAAVIAYGVLAVVRSGKLNILRLLVSAVLLGTAICAMHYTGMAAMEMDGDLRYTPGLFFLSFVIAVTASGAALWIVFTLGQHEGRGKLAWQTIAALVMGGAICGMHYTGMAASVFIPWADCRYDPDQRFDSLALFLAVTSSAIFVIAITLSIYQGVGEAKEKAQIKIQDQKGKIKNIGRAVFLQLSALLTILILLFSGSYLYVIHTQQQKVHDSAIVNSAGLQRMLIQRFTREITTTIAAHASEDWKTVVKSKKAASHTQTLIETNFKGFLEGGPIVLNADDSRRTTIGSLPFERAIEAIHDAQKEWETLKRTATVTLQANTENITDNPRYIELSEQANKTVKAQDNAVNAIEEEIRKDTERVILIQQIVLISSVACFLVILAYTYYRIFLPINLIYGELKDHRDNLQNMVLDQTKDLLRAKEHAENLNLKLQEERDTIKLLELITNAINEADNLQDAIQVCLKEVCEFAGWPVGHAYLVDESRKELVPSKIWYLENEDHFEEFRKVTEKTTFALGVGLPGRIYKSRKPEWIKDVMQDQNFPRRKFLREGNVSTGLGFPVLIKKNVVAVLEFFAGSIEKPDQEFMNIMGSIGTQLGRITERVTIQKAQKEAEKANQAKSEFLANMSHELRTPLNSIMGMTRMFTEDPDLSNDNRAMAGTVLKSATNLLEIVNDILDISKIEAGSMVLEKSGFDLKNMIANVMETMAPVASAKGIALKYHFSNEEIPFLVGDPFRLSRVLTNLVSNAIKYTSSGEVGIMIDHTHQPAETADISTFEIDTDGVEVNIETKTLKEGKAEIYCEVKDTGIGIPKDKLKMIFDKFTQADETITRKYGGTGLGLAITKDLVELMGGEIGVDSEVGKGSTFWFRIPFDITDKASEDSKDRGKARRRKAIKDRGEPVIQAENARILVAEDHLLNQEFIQRLLSRIGLRHVDLAENGEQTLQAYKEEDYDLILMDCHMPDKNGYETTEEIRKDEKNTGKHIPIIALTADAMKGTQEKCLKAGMDEYITKPIDADELRDILEQWIAFSKEDTGREGVSDNKGVEKSKEHAATKKREENPVDLSALKAYAETPEDLRQMINVFISQAERDIKILAQHCVNGQSIAWIETAHKMKGGAGTAGAFTMHKLCEKAQAMETATLKERAVILEQINKAFNEAKEYLKNVELS